MAWKIVKVGDNYHCSKNGEVWYKTDDKKDAEWYVNYQIEIDNDKTPLPKEIWF